MLKKIQLICGLLSNVFLRPVFFIRHKLFSVSISKPGIRIEIPEFLLRALSDLYVSEEFITIERIREKVYSDKRVLTGRDLGAGSFNLKPERSVGDMLKTASVNNKYGKLLSGIAYFFNPQKIVELGTAAGISTMFLASGAPLSSVITIEANHLLAEIAKNNFIRGNFRNISLINNEFDKFLPDILNEKYNRLLVYIDGNHKFEASIKYFNFFAGLNSNEILIIFDDIYWSSGMIRAWQEIISDIRVNISIDLYYKGIVYINNKEIRNNHYKLKYN